LEKYAFAFFCILSINFIESIKIFLPVIFEDKKMLDCPGKISSVVMNGKYIYYLVVWLYCGGWEGGTVNMDQLGRYSMSL